MLKRLLKQIGVYFIDPSTPFKTFFNASRFPSAEIARLYGAVIDIYLQPGGTSYRIYHLLNPTGEAYQKTFPCEKLSFLLDDSTASQNMETEAFKLLTWHEKETYDKRRGELVEMYDQFKQYRVALQASNYPEINEAIFAFKLFLPSWAAFEIAKMLPWWLEWFTGTKPNRLQAWARTDYYRAYLDKIEPIERPVVEKIFKDFFAASTLTDLGIIAIEN